MTKYKKAILEIINSSCSHLTANEVYELIKKDYPDVVLATIYNNINSLCDDGLIRRLSIEGQIDHYDKIKRHDHLVCKQCGRLSDFTFSDYTKTLSEQAHVQVLGYDLEVFYLCDECKKKINKN